MSILPPNLISATNALVGQLLAVENLDVLIKSVQLIQDVKYNGESVKTRGVFLIIKCEVANLGKYYINAFGAMLSLFDDKNNEIRGFLDRNAISGLHKIGYTGSEHVAPSFVGIIPLYYDLPLDITGLRLEVHPSYKVLNRQPSLESFKFSGGKGPDSGAGQELVGQTYNNRKTKIKAKVFKVDRLTEINNGDKIIKPEGVFLVVAYELENGSKKPVNWPSFQIQDSAGRVYGTSINPEAFVALSHKYKRDITVYPGQKGFGYMLYELVKEANGFKIAPGFFD